MRSEGTGPLAKAAGLLAVGAVVAAAWLAGRSAWAAQAGFSLLTLAIVIGMLAGNTVYPRVAVRCHAGMLFCKGPLLRLGIMLYGFRLTLGQVLDVGLASFAADALMLASTFLLTCWLGLRWLKMERQTVLLMGAGSSICGAAAVIATAPVLRAGADRVAVAVATVVIYGTAGIFLYPQMHAWHWWPLSDGQFGVYIGSSVHEVAQVVAAGKAINAEVADIAVTTKMIRVMMLAPFLLLLSLWLGRRGAPAPQGQTGQGEKEGEGRIVIPWFAFVFIGVMLFNSLNLLPAAWVAALVQADTWLLAMAMAALGLSTHFSAIRQAGIKPLLLGLLVFAWLVGAGGLVQVLLAA